MTDGVLSTQVKELGADKQLATAGLDFAHLERYAMSQIDRNSKVCKINL